ncbi:MAG: electron transfer flavoprotein subunit alpha/FixB family protein [Bdellovibrionales bacterium]
MAKVLVFCEFGDGGLKKGSIELLTAAKASGREVHALILGPDGKSKAASVSHFGAQTLWVCGDDKLANYNPELYTAAASAAIKDSGADVVLASSSMLARDLFPRVGARLDTGVASDCVTLELNGSGVKARRPLFAGKCTAEVEFHNSPVKIVLMRPNQLPVSAANTAAAASVKDFTLPPSDVKTTVQSVAKGAAGKIDLTEANTIVSGGRGMKGPEHFKLLEDLAATIHGTVGASRAVADAGWVPHSMQVGQTGKTVAPSLYIACGISGAIQHLAGMSGSKVIVAINKDPDAPIFQKSTYGIAGDLFEVVPKLTEAFRSALK